MLSPIYTLKNRHPSGSTVTLVASTSPVVVNPDGSDYAFYVTTSVAGTLYAEELIKQISAIGINIVFTIKYPSDYGLGKFGTEYSEIYYVYGSDTAVI